MHHSNEVGAVAAKIDKGAPAGQNWISEPAQKFPAYADLLRAWIPMHMAMNQACYSDT